MLKLRLLVLFLAILVSPVQAEHSGTVTSSGGMSGGGATIHLKALISSLNEKDVESCRAPVSDIYQAKYDDTIDKPRIPDGLFQGTLSSFIKNTCRYIKNKEMENVENLFPSQGMNASPAVPPDQFKRSHLEEILGAPVNGIASVQSVHGIDYAQAMADQKEALERVLKQEAEKNPGKKMEQVLEQDVLHHYQGNEAWKSLDSSANESSSLFGVNSIKLYSLMLPLAMMESDGRISEGLDRTTTNFDETAEAGLFQVSFNSTHKPYWPGMSELYESLQDEYGVRGQSSAEMLRNPRCMVNVYAKNIPETSNTENVGNDAEALRFQSIMKACPALATDYMLVFARIGMKNNGPILRQEAQPKEACVNIFLKLQQKLEGDPSLCQAQNVRLESTT